MGLVQRIALIDATGHLLFEELARVAAAIDLQVKRDLSRFWPVNATVSALSSAAFLPPGVWPVYVVSETADDSAGFHSTFHGQPIANVLEGPSWSIAASHEVMEMLVDPSGNRLVAGRAIKASETGEVYDIHGTHEYLLEICDPSQDPSLAYDIDGVLVSDFYTPSFFDPQRACGARYSFSGAITHPRRVANGGYLSWWDATKLQMWRLDCVTYQRPKIVFTGHHLPNQSLREFVDGEMRGKANLSGGKQRHPPRNMTEMDVRLAPVGDR